MEIYNFLFGRLFLGHPVYASKFKTSSVWFDAPFHEESEYGLRFYFWPCFNGVNCQKPFAQIPQKAGFWHFTAYGILSLSPSE